MPRGIQDRVLAEEGGMATETLGQRIKRLRERAGLSQAGAAAAAGVPVATLRNWEYDRRVPLLTAAAELAEALGVELGELAKGEAIPDSATRKGPTGPQQAGHGGQGSSTPNAKKRPPRGTAGGRKGTGRKGG
jgi:DNA-binding XRE family transcriptional regulator